MRGRGGASLGGVVAWHRVRSRRQYRLRAAGRGTRGGNARFLEEVTRPVNSREKQAFLDVRDKAVASGL